MFRNFFLNYNKSSYSLSFWFESFSEEKVKLDDERIVRITKIAISKEDRMLTKKEILEYGGGIL